MVGGDGLSESAASKPACWPGNGKGGSPCSQYHYLLMQRELDASPARLMIS